MAKKTIVTPLEAAPTRFDRIVVSLVITFFVIAVAAMIALFIANVNAQGGIWPTIELLPLIAIPAAFIGLIILVVRTGIRRAHDARDAGK